MSNQAHASGTPRKVAPARRVLIVIPTLGGGGAERTAVGLANRLADDGIKVLVATFNRGAAFFPLNSSVERTFLVEKARFRAVGRLALVVALRRLVRREQPDICLGYSFQAAILTALATLGRPAKSVLCERSDPTRYPLFQRLVAMILWSASDGAIFQSEYAKGFYLRSRTSGTVIPNCLDDSILSPIIEQREQYALIVGRLETIRDPLSALQAYYQVSERFPELKLIIVGDGSLRQLLEEWVADHGLKSRVSFEGAVTDVGAYYQHARVFISSSTTEGYPNALLEALAMGVPAAVVDAPTYTQRTLVSMGSGILVAPGNTLALANAVDRILKEEHFLFDAINRSSRIRENHASSNVFNDWLSYLNRVAS